MPKYRLLTNAAIGSPESEPPVSPNAWSLYARLEDGSTDTLCLVRQISGMVALDQREALRGLAKLIKVAATGRPVQDMYDKKQCHIVHEFNYPEMPPTRRVVYRIRAGAKVRVTFIYGEDRSIVVLNAFPKREDRMNNAQISMLVNEAKIYLDVKAQNRFEIVGI